MTKNARRAWVEYLLTVGFIFGLAFGTTPDAPLWARMAGFFLIGVCLRPLIATVARREARR